MKISLNKIRFAHEHYGPEGLVDGGVDGLVEKIGSQLGEVEEVIDRSHWFEGVVIVKVISCIDHPNADRLHVCKIDDGGKTQGVDRDEDGHVQVVCGAPNVRAGLSVAWLPPGSTVPESRGKDPFVLEARELRGVVSNGMLASPRELGVGDNHEGILEVDIDVAPGTSFAEAYRAEGEAIIDVENKMFTHRPDCFGWLGVIREIAGIQHKAFKSPDWYVVNPEFPGVETDELKLEVKNELPELVPRFTAVAMSGVEIKPSPVWLQIVLSEVGVRPINNVVDYTNFWMLETGQPLHAYDYDKVKSLSGGTATLVVRYPKQGEKITLLSGKEIEPRREAVMIATDKQLIGVGGVMGGADTEVDENTKNIILECANFDMYSIRRTSMEHGLFTDAVTRFTKGQSPLQNLAVLAKTVESLQQNAGGKIASALIDDNHLPKDVLERGSLRPPVTLTAEFINTRLGLKLTADEMARLLQNVEFDVETKGDELTVRVPFWRTDVELREDVVEEIGRLYGFDHLPLELPMRKITPAAKDPLLETKSKIRGILSAAGANEVLTYSFVHGNLLEKVGQNPESAFKLSNALSPDLQYYRLSLIPSLLDRIHANIKAGYDEFALFEIGKVHTRERGANADGIPVEDEYMALVVAAADKIGKAGTAYYEARKYLESLAGTALDFKPVTADTQTFAVMQPYQAGRAATVSIKATGKFLGIIGEFKPSVTKNLKLPKYCAGFELDTTALQEVLSQPNKYVALPKYPKIEQDISLKVPADLSYQELYNFVWGELEKVQPENTLPNLGPLDIYQSKDDEEHKNITLRFTIASFDKTMRTEEVSAMLDAAAEAAKQKFGAERL